MKNGLFDPGDHVMRGHYYIGRVAARYANGDLAITDSVKPVSPNDLTMVNEKAIQDAFDLGFKAAGGTQIPDNARDMVELALDRDQINEIADVLQIWVKGHGNEPIERFLETISIYRSKKP